MFRGKTIFNFLLVALLCSNYSCASSSHSDKKDDKSKQTAVVSKELAAEQALLRTPQNKSDTDIEKNQQAIANDLIVGNARYVEGRPNNSNRDAATRTTLVGGQKPGAIVLSCSDSRVPPEIIFDQGLGQIFVVRTAGHVADPVAIASIEYAIEHLGSKVLIVLGHEYCGAVNAAISSLTTTATHEHGGGSKNIELLLSKIIPNVKAQAYTASTDKTLRAPVKANVTGVIKTLLSRSKIIRDAYKAKELRILPGIYSLSSGVVEFDNWNY